LTIDKTIGKGSERKKKVGLPKAALLSGKDPLHPVVHNVLLPRSTAALPLEEDTLADVLNPGGYQTHAVGKWQVGHSQWEPTPTFRGFDSFFGFYVTTYTTKIALANIWRSVEASKDGLHGCDDLWLLRIEHSRRIK
jgi:hypothetical protein